MEPGIGIFAQVEMGEGVGNWEEDKITTPSPINGQGLMGCEIALFGVNEGGWANAVAVAVGGVRGNT